MYRPPENSNRVKSIRSKFEQNLSQNERNVETKKTEGQPIAKSKTEIAVQRPKLTQQLSDPNKRNNIKRTPAFRLDRGLDRSVAFQRSNANNRSTYFEKKSNQFNDENHTNNNCDSNKNVINGINEKTETVKKATPCKPALIKSKSSHDFAYLRSKFDKSQDVTIPNDSKRDVGLLYTEPIPKCLRVKPPEVVSKNIEKTSENDIYHANTLKLVHDNNKTSSDTETFKSVLNSVLKRPLPSGPAPRKPPRTFAHNSPKGLERNQSALHGPKDKKADSSNKKPSTKSRDPRYMLNKLEHALRANKIKTLKLKPVKPDISTTSGEDSDDSLLFRSKSSRNFSGLPQPPSDSSPIDSNAFNFNCLNGITCSKPRYEQIKQPNSSFFVSCKEEPVYAEPYEFTYEKGPGPKLSTGENKRNRLYYLSTPLLCDINGQHSTMRKNCDRNDNNDGATSQDSKLRNQHQISAENSSLSSFTSDLDSAASTPVEERETMESTLKIKRLIDAFEANRQENAPKAKTGGGSKDGGNNGSDFDDKEGTTSVDRIIDKFQTYVKTMPKYRKCRMKDGGLFYCCLIVGWESKAPKIKFKFPKNVEIPHKIEDLCYPEAASGPLDRSNNAQCYSLVITNDKGERTFGYCRRVIPEGSTNCLPLAYCILSKNRSPRFYKKILAELESRHGLPDKLRDELISEFYCNVFPKPGQSISINLTKVLRESNACNSASSAKESKESLDLTSYGHTNKTSEYGTLNSLRKDKSKSPEVVLSSGDVKDCCESPGVISERNGKCELTLTLHSDMRYEDADLRPLHQLPYQILLKVFASLLLERKVILISCVLSKLSACVDALQSILYPFSWPHTFIPILPQCLWDVVESPTPVVCGILSVAVVNEYKIEHGVVVDLDEGCILSEEGDEDSILCNSMKKAWEQGMALATSVPSNDYVHSVYLSDAYIKVFTHSLRNYKNFIIDGDFQKEAFIRNGKTKGVRRFLKWFTETTLFTSFIDAVIANPQSFALFDNKMETYSSGDSDLILSKLLEWKK